MTRDELTQLHCALQRNDMPCGLLLGPIMVIVNYEGTWRRLLTRMAFFLLEKSGWELCGPKEWVPK